MGLIIDHSGLILCIGVVALLAIIGYYADKKDTENKKIDKNIKNDNVEIEHYVVDKPTNFNELPNVQSKINDVVSDFNQVNDNNGISIQEPIAEIAGNDVSTVSDNFNNIDSASFVNDEISNSNVSQDTLSDFNSNNLVESVDSFGFNNFENIDMSLDDLEKKNYDSILSEKTAYNDDDNFYYSDLEEGNNPIISNIHNDSISVDETNPIALNSDDKSAVDLSISSNNSDIDIYQGHEFDNEVLSTIDDDNSNNEVLSTIDNDSSNNSLFGEANSNVSDNGMDNSFMADIDTKDMSESVPELFSTDDSAIFGATDNSNQPSESGNIDESAYDLSNDSVDNDIWKF